jgi:hypothetical protein
MTTFLEAAQYQRMVHLSPNPHDKARELTAEQFRPQKEKDHAIEREHTEHGNN